MPTFCLIQVHNTALKFQWLTKNVEKMITEYDVMKINDKFNS